MNAQPAAEAVRSRAWQLTLVALPAGVAFAFHAVTADMVRVWVKYPDYSHGFLVAPFAAYLLYTCRAKLPAAFAWPDPLGLVPLVLGFVWRELKLIDWLFVVPDRPDRDRVIRSAARTAAAGWVMTGAAPAPPPEAAR